MIDRFVHIKQAIVKLHLLSEMIPSYATCLSKTRSRFASFLRMTENAADTK